MIFDPVLEPDATPPALPGDLWNAAWIWYPGQLGAHLNPHIFQKAIHRCTHIGYPGNFRHPEYHAAYRLRTTLSAPVTARWAAPAGRARVRINGREGDITLREAQIPQGAVEIFVLVDLTVSLPCFMLEGPGLSTGEGWEASIDGGETWVPVESGPNPVSPRRLPDLWIDFYLKLKPRQVVAVRQGDESEGGYSLQPGGEVVLDFWHNELGNLEITAAGAGELRISVGESVLEAEEVDPRVGEQYPLAPLTLTGFPQVYHLPERCLRYVRFQSSGACRIQRVLFHARIYPVQYKGWFETGDETLDNIWKAGAATLHSNLHDGAVLDGLKRDALVWLFDENIDFEGIDCIFFDRDVVRNTLVSKTLPPNPQPKDIGILDMRLYYLLGFYQEYLASGDAAFVTRYRQPIIELLTLLESLQDADGFIPARAFSPQASQASEAGVEGVDYLSEYVPDWAGKSDRAGTVRPTDIDGAGTPAYAQMMLMRCFEIGEIFARMWDQEALARRYKDKAANLREAIRTAFWDGSRSLFINGLTRAGARDERVTMYAQAWGLLTGLVPEEEMDRTASAMAKLDPRPANISMSTYWEYLAYIRAGRFDLALIPLREHWGRQIEQGLSRFIEDIRPGDDERARLVFYNRPYGLSLNHGWSGATAVSILMRGALGLQILAPGYQQIELTPHWREFARLRLVLPTPLGALAVSYERGSIDLLQVPAGMVVRLRQGQSVRELVGPATFDLQ